VFVAKGSQSVDRFPNELLQRGIESAAAASGTPVTEITQRNVEAIARMEKDAEASRTTGDRMADRFAAVVGSWTFIAIQSVLLLVWIFLNILAWSYRWDPYPFILLNLALSFEAAFATPIIMMSQNRQARLAEKRNRLDLQINLLAEQENTELLRMVRKLCEKAGIALHEGNVSLEQDTPTEIVARQIDEASVPEPLQE
jgi:uncharacterized membrane protein